MLNEIKKRTSTRLQDSKGKDIYLIDYPEYYARGIFSIDGYQDILDKKDEFLTDWEKRAPMGFHGTRGKKMILNTLQELEKRGVMGFRVSKRQFLSFPFLYTLLSLQQSLQFLVYIYLVSIE